MSSKLYAQELKVRKPGAPSRLYETVVKKLEAGETVGG